MVSEYESNTDRILRKKKERKAERAAQQAKRKRQREERRAAILGTERIKKAVENRTLAKNPDALRVADKPAKNPSVVSVRNLPKPAKNPDVVSVRNLPKPAKNPDAVSVRNLPKPAMNPDVLKVANLLKNTPRGSDAPITRSTADATPRAKPPVPSRSTANATPRDKPPVSRRPTVGGNMMGGIPKGGGTLSKKDIDEYSEAFESPDAEKMFSLAEKNRRKDMNMLERGFDSIIQAGERASAERRRQGKSDFDMNEDVYGMSRGGRLNGSTKNKPKVRKRAARRGFGVETRGS